MNRPNDAFQVSTECFPNITARGRKRRVLQGVFATALTLAVFAALLLSRAAPVAFLLVAPFAGYASLLFLQAKEKT